nr:hypothetical protein [Tanacetum cinerariifolium]
MRRVGAHAASIVAKGDVSAANDEVPTAVDKPSIPSPTPPTPSPQPSQDQPLNSQVNDVTRLQALVDKKKVVITEASIRDALRLDDAEGIECLPNEEIFAELTRMSYEKPSTKLTFYKAFSSQWKFLIHTILQCAHAASIVAKGDVSAANDEVPTAVDKPSIPSPTPPTPPPQPSQDQPLNSQHPVKVVVNVVVIVVELEVSEVDAARRRKGVEIRDPQETATPSTIIHSEAKSKDKEKAEKDNAVKIYQALKKKPETESQARKNMMIYLRNVVGFKMDYFKGMSYDDIRPIFEKHFDSNVAFLQKTKEQMDEEDSRALKRLNESQEDKAAKKQKLDKEVEELKRHLQIVPNDEDDIYTEATPLALKLILLVERRYPLIRFTLDQMLNNVRLDVEKDTEVSLELLSFGVDVAMDFKENMLSV